MSESESDSRGGGQHLYVIHPSKCISSGGSRRVFAGGANLMQGGDPYCRGDETPVFGRVWTFFYHF
jgi:hypothetical protein